MKPIVMAAMASPAGIWFWQCFRRCLQRPDHTGGTILGAIAGGVLGGAVSHGNGGAVVGGALWGARRQCHLA